MCWRYRSAGKCRCESSSLVQFALRLYAWVYPPPPTPPQPSPTPPAPPHPIPPQPHSTPPPHLSLTPVSPGPTHPHLAPPRPPSPCPALTVHHLFPSLPTPDPNPHLPSRADVQDVSPSTSNGRRLQTTTSQCLKMETNAHWLATKAASKELDSSQTSLFSIYEGKQDLHWLLFKRTWLKVPADPNQTTFTLPQVSDGSSKVIKHEVRTVSEELPTPQRVLITIHCQHARACMSPSWISLLGSNSWDLTVGISLLGSHFWHSHPVV